MGKIRKTRVYFRAGVELYVGEINCQAREYCIQLTNRLVVS